MKIANYIIRLLLTLFPLVGVLAGADREGPMSEIDEIHAAIEAAFQEIEGIVAARSADIGSLLGLPDSESTEIASKLPDDPVTRTYHVETEIDGIGGIERFDSSFQIKSDRNGYICCRILIPNEPAKLWVISKAGVEEYESDELVRLRFLRKRVFALLAKVKEQNSLKDAKVGGEQVFP